MVSTLQDTIATQGRLLAENERYRQDSPHDSASADANREINRSRSVLGRNERARDGRE